MSLRKRLTFADESELLKGCLSHDKKSWDIFVETYIRLISNAILRTLNRYSPAPETWLVDDLTHSVFLSLIENNYKKLRQFQWKCKLSSWLHTIAARATIDHLRKQQDHASLNGDDEEGKSLKESIPNGRSLPSEVLELKEEKEIFEQVKKTLTPRERLFVELYYIQELSHPEIARIMNTTKNNSYQLRSSVEAKMKELVERVYKNPEVKTS